MRPACDPQDVCAVIVGVEHCAVFDDDPLVGPVRDAIEWFDWLRECGVPSERMRLFISAKPVSQGLLDDWATRRGQAVLDEATETRFRRFIVEDLPLLAGKGRNALLLVVWSGHGMIDLRDASRTRRLFYADASTDIALNLELVSFMKALRAPRYAGFTQQIAVIDACANDAFGFSQGRRLYQPTDFGAFAGALNIEQRVLLATAPGQLAGSIGGASARESVALFSHRLLAALRAQPTMANAAGAAAWPDFKAAFLATRAAFEAVDQTPVDWAFGIPDDSLPDSGVQVLPGVQATRLVAALAGLDDPVLQQAYHAALAPAEPTAAHHDAARGGPAAMASLLSATAARPGEPGALARWAEQVRSRLDPPEQQPELLTWLKQYADAALLATYRVQVQAAAQRAQPSPLCFVLVNEVGAGDPPGPAELHAWWFGGEPVRPRVLTDGHTPLVVQPDGSGRAQALRWVLDRATEEAQELGIDLPEFIVEFALPLERIDDDIEIQPVGAQPLRERAIGTQHAVVRRLADRLAALGHSRAGGAAAIMLWKKAALSLRQRFAQHGLRIVWIEPAQIVQGQLPHRLGQMPQGSCIGLARSTPGRALDGMAKTSLFEDGLPFACWSDAAWTDADTERLDLDMGACAGPDALKKLYDLKAAAGFREHPSTRLRIVWDDPARNPYAATLKAASP